MFADQFPKSKRRAENPIDALEKRCRRQLIAIYVHLGYDVEALGS